MENKKILLTSVSLLFLTGCSNSFIRYGVKKPYIELESSLQETGVLKEVMPSEVINKIENKDTFMLYIHASYCNHCKDSEKNFLNPYLEKNPVIIYGIDLGNFIGATEDNEEYYNYYSVQLKSILGKSYQGTPYYGLFKDGKFIKGEQDFDYFSLFFKTYVITEGTN